MTEEKLMERLLILSLILLSLKAHGLDRERYEACLKDFPKLKKSYFVLDARESCERYAKVTPDESTKKCVDETLGSRALTRDYYLNYESVAQLCATEKNLDSQRKSCIKKKIQYGGDAVMASNKCDSGIDKCIKRLEARKPSKGVKAVGDTYYHFCFTFSDEPEMGNCVADTISAHPTLAQNAKVLQNYCHPKTQSCKKSLLPLLGKKRPKTDEVVLMGNICDTALKSEAGETWPHCAFSLTLKQNLKPRIAGEICALPNENGRQCILDHLEKKLSYDDAQYICKFQLPGTRECLLQRHQKTSPFDVNPLAKIDQEGAEAYCFLESEEERACFLKGIGSGATKELVAKCRQGTESYKRCVDDYDDYFPRNHPLNVTASTGRKICSLPVEELRVCLFNSIMKREYVKPKTLWSEAKTWFPYEEYLEKCQGQLLGHLLGELEVDPAYSCRNDHFYQQSTYDKGWDCATASSKKVCREFATQIEAMEDKDLKAHCRLFRRGIGDDEAYGNPLYMKCKRRSLLPR